MEPVVIILLLVLLLCLAGVWQLIKEQKKKSGQLALALAYERMVMKHKLAIEHMEVFDNRIVALDRKQKKLLFLYHAADVHQHELVSLQDIASLQLIEEREELKGFIRKVFLALTCAADSTTYRLCFYDHSKDAPTILLPAMRRARNWKQRVGVNRNPGTVSLESEYVF